MAEGFGGDEMTNRATLRFEGKVVIVTGAASGIGRVAAEKFGLEGATVVLADIDVSGLESTLASMTESGSAAEIVVTDVADPAAVKSLVNTTVAHHGGLHVLHNNAYWAPLNHDVIDTSWEQWQRTLNTTLASAFLGCKFGIPAMIASGGGAIVNMGSQASFVASPKFAAYHAAKAGILGLTRSVAFDYGARGIRCNVVCPGLTETPATRDVIGDPERKAWLTSKILLGRIGRPEDIANAVLFVASDEASFMTGQSLTIDGGRLIA